MRIGEDLETAAMKNAQVSRHKAGDTERASHLLLATRKCYQHFALDYCLQVRSRRYDQRFTTFEYQTLKHVTRFVFAAQQLQDSAEDRRPKLGESTESLNTPTVVLKEQAAFY